MQAYSRDNIEFGIIISTSYLDFYLFTFLCYYSVLPNTVSRLNINIFVESYVYINII
jgi:hypothetical protein